VNGALAFGTSLGYINFILSLSEDLSRSTNRVETFQFKGQPKIMAIRGLVEEVQSDTVAEESKHVYTFIVKTVTEVVSVQCDAAQAQSGNKGQQKAAPLPIEIKATYQKRDDSEFDNAIGLYTCFRANQQGSRQTSSSCVVSFMEDKD